MKVKRTPGLLDMFGGTVELETANVNLEDVRNMYQEGPSKLLFNASSLEDVIFRIGGEEFHIDFPALVRDYGKAVGNGG